MYAKYIVDSYAVNAAGDKVDGVDAFALLSDLKTQYDKPENERVLPVFVSKNDEGNISYVIPVWGAGLWGPVWGYIALADDWDTVDGVVFGHKSETPGLGSMFVNGGVESWNLLRGKRRNPDRAKRFSLSDLEIDEFPRENA